LAALNIQRGRDHGLWSYNKMRQLVQMPLKNTFEEISSDPLIVAGLKRAYASVDDIDLYVGGLAEDHKNGAMVGELFSAIIRNQFTRLRDGDRFWYEKDLPAPWLAWVKSQKLADIIVRNTEIKKEEIGNDVFQSP
jgi:peroxidase